MLHFQRIFNPIFGKFAFRQDALYFKYNNLAYSCVNRHKFKIPNKVIKLPNKFLKSRSAGVKYTRKLQAYLRTSPRVANHPQATTDVG